MIMEIWPGEGRDSMIMKLKSARAALSK